jgi:large subunit ribosomal protein L35
MPKMKTKSAAKKRFKLSGTGKVRRTQAFHRHNFSHKSSKRSRRLRQTITADPSNVRQIKRMLLA